MLLFHLLAAGLFGELMTFQSSVHDSLILSFCVYICADFVCVEDDAWYWEHLDTSWAWNSYQGPQLQWLGTTDRHALHIHPCLIQHMASQHMPAMQASHPTSSDCNC